jgi:hypothetical protein
MSKKKETPQESNDEFLVGCTVKELPEKKQAKAVQTAVEENPANRPRVGMLSKLLEESMIEEVTRPAFLSVLTTKYWGSAGKKLGVSFMENTASELRDRIISHMNAWKEFCNVEFSWSQSQGEVRISRGGDGYWSYLGTDILHIPAGQPTMTLQGFVMATPESEYKRVVRHETGHTLGFPHEHMRKQIIAKLDVQKTIAYFLKYQGWDEQTTREQVLTSLNEASIMGTPNADETSIMCYQLPASITKDGKPIVGGDDINDADKAFAAKLYPLPAGPTNPPPPPIGGGTNRLVIEFSGSISNPKIVV